MWSRESVPIYYPKMFYLFCLILRYYGITLRRFDLSSFSFSNPIPTPSQDEEENSQTETFPGKLQKKKTVGKCASPMITPPETAPHLHRQGRGRFWWMWMTWISTARGLWIRSLTYPHRIAWYLRFSSPLPPSSLAPLSGRSPTSEVPLTTVATMRRSAPPPVFLRFVSPIILSSSLVSSLAEL